MHRRANLKLSRRSRLDLYACQLRFEETGSVHCNYWSSIFFPRAEPQTLPGELPSARCLGKTSCRILLKMRRNYVCLAADKGTVVCGSAITLLMLCH